MSRLWAVFVSGRLKATDDRKGMALSSDRLREAAVSMGRASLWSKQDQEKHGRGCRGGRSQADCILTNQTNAVLSSDKKTRGSLEGGVSVGFSYSLFAIKRKVSEIYPGSSRPRPETGRKNNRWFPTPGDDTGGSCIFQRGFAIR